MGNTTWKRLIVMASLAAAGSLTAGAGCSQSHDLNNVGKPDMVFVFADVDSGPGSDVDGGDPGAPNACGEPGCVQGGFDPGAGQPFPLHNDPNMDGNEADDGIGRDPMGFLGLNSTSASFDYLWIANSDDWGRGTLSKIDSKKVREVARYFSVTCQSNPMGSKASCDGTKGCCTMDDGPRYVTRAAKMNPLPGHQPVQLMSNSPSRTSVDFNGDMFVSNRAFGGQSSLTKIANDISDCKDRNKNGKIDTSNDANGDGRIQTDCNNNNVPDDLDDVKATPCAGGVKQEFFGIDDECILWTTNTGEQPDLLGRPLSLGPGAIDGGPSDAWAGMFTAGIFYRVDGVTGLTKEKVTLSGGCEPYGLVVDSQGIGWSPNLWANPLCWFNTKAVNGQHEVGKAVDPPGGLQGYGIGLDRDQNIWVGGMSGGFGGNAPGAYRYTPDRTNGTKNLSNGWWTQITDAGAAAGASGVGRGIAADSRTANQYFVWMAGNEGWIVRIPASDIKMLKMNQTINGNAYPAIHVAGTSISGAGVDRNQNVWSVATSGSVTTRTVVDAKGNFMQPDTVGAAVGNNKCPAGDRCELKDNNNSEPGPYTYSDFTGFGLRNFTRPKGTYSYIFKGCQDSNGNASDTRWYAVDYTADVPPNTALTVHTRVGKTPKPDDTWGMWTTPYTTSPADLRTNMPLLPFDVDNYYMQVEFTFTTMEKNASPKLKAFTVGYKCGKIM